MTMDSLEEAPEFVEEVTIIDQDETVINNDLDKQVDVPKKPKIYQPQNLKGGQPFRLPELSNIPKGFFQRRSRKGCILSAYCKDVVTPPSDNPLVFRRDFIIKQTWIPLIRQALGKGEDWSPKYHQTICHRHFHVDDIYYMPTRSKVKEGKVPTLHMGPRIDPPTSKISSNPHDDLNPDSQQSPRANINENPDFSTNSNVQANIELDCATTSEGIIAELLVKLIASNKQLEEKDMEIVKLNKRIEKIESTMKAMHQFLAECKSKDWTT